MNWRIFITACTSTAIISFPQNIIGCGGDGDPYDYYTSFFHLNNTDVQGLKPFYYTGALRLYDETEPVDQSTVLAKEWVDYCGNAAKENDVYDLVYKYDLKDLNSLYYFIEKNQPLTVPDSVSNNSMSVYFKQSKDLEALGYILFAKKIEPLVTGVSDYWEPVVRDSVKMNKLLINGTQLYNAAKKDFIKLRYAYQVLRLALYSKNYAAVDKYYADYFSNNNTKNLVTQLCLSMKAGSLYHNGNKAEAAYIYSQAFAMSDVKKITNYNSFSWSVANQPKESALAFCKNNTEKANMLALFGLTTPGNALSTLKAIAAIDPNLPALEVLCTREINKTEENYLSPLLSKKPGGIQNFYQYYYYGNDNSARVSDRLAEAKALTAFIQQLANNKSVSNKGFYETIAAYSAFITADYTTAKASLKKAQTIKLTQKLKDQCALTALLVTLNEQSTIDAAFEQQILPSLQWLKSRAEKSKANEPTDNAYGLGYWEQFYRNVMNDVIGKRYHQQNNLVREVLASGTVLPPLDFVQNNLSSADLLTLNELLESKNKTAYEKFMCDNFSVTGDTLKDIIATSYARTYDFKNAIAWRKKITAKDISVLGRDPFNDLLKDNQEDTYPSDKGNFSKIQFAQTMADLLDKDQAQKATAADLFKLASGFYNMTYYGRAWETVKYYRSTVDGYYIPKNASAFDKDYYGCYTAEKYYNKAMMASTDNNFKARCLFMMAKCSQKQVQKPQYDDFPNDWDKYRAAGDKYMLAFQNNKHFPELKKLYSTTPFYKTAFNSCSYLRDFVRKK